MRTANERANERHRSSNMERPDVFLTSKVTSSSLFLSLCILLRWLNSPKLLESVELFHELSRNFQTLSISQTSKLPQQTFPFPPSEDWKSWPGFSLYPFIYGRSADLHTARERRISVKDRRAKFRSLNVLAPHVERHERTAIQSSLRRGW